MKDEDEPKTKIILKVGKLARKAAVVAEARIQESEQLDDASETSNPEEESNLIEDLFTAVMTASDADNKPLHTAFQLLPSKKKYPEYYDIIPNPIDLKAIAIKIQSGDYGHINDLEKDLLTMTRNACMFNEPGSQIYKDAKTLKKVISSKKIEIVHGIYSGAKSSERIRNKRLRGSSTLSAVTAALPDDDSDMEDQEEVMEEEEVSIKN